MKIKELIDKVDSEFYKENNYYLSITNPEIFTQTVAKIFAKFHVELALKEASKKVNYHYLYEYECEDHTPYWGACGNCGSYSNNEVLVGVEIDKDSILNAYDLNNIK